MSRNNCHNSRKESMGIASHASKTFWLSAWGSAGQPSSLSLIHLTIHDRTTSVRLRSGEFGGHAGKRSNSLV